MKTRFIPLILLFITIISLFLSLSSGYSVKWSSPNMSFNVTPDTIYLNWTNNYNSSFLVFVNDTYGVWFNITIDNTTAITQTIHYSLYFNYTSGAYSCGVGTTPCAKLLVHNETGNYVTASKNLTNISTQNNETFYLINNESSSLWAGRYRGIVRIYNTSVATEHANITVVLDIPAQINNNTGIGSFSGTLPINTSIYQSFYFNTTSLPNAIAVKINISGWTSSQDVDLFLFDNSSTPQLLAKSINKSSTDESLAYSFLPSTEKIWEIRVYGNHTSSISYSGNIFFTTLNSSVRTLDFSVRNVSYTNQSMITLNNVGNLNISNVLESKELYHVIRFAGNGTQNFTFLVPDSTVAQKVKVSLNWTVSNSSYLLNVYKPDNSLAFTSVNKFLYANISNANLEEYDEITNINKGYWTVEVKNSTNVTAIDPYNVTAYIYVNASNWIVTNYTNSTSGVTFNATNSTSVQVNLTIPNTTMNGLYEGSLQYLDRNGVGIKIPISVNVTAPTLLVNRTLSSSTVTVVENINATLLRFLNITLNNTGSYDISSIATTNSTSLNNGNYYINFSYQAPTSLFAGSSGILNITMNLNASITNDSTGIYSGWIILNTNASSYHSAPYPNFTLNIEFNLTNQLDVRVIGVNTYDTTANWITNASTLPKNVTIQYLNLYYINGTPITGSSLFNYTNISSVRLYQANASYWTSYLNKSETGFSPNPFEVPVNSGNYRFNITIPIGLPGGNYQVHVSLTNANGKLQGESSNTTLFINDTGLYMGLVSYPSSLSNSSSGTVNVSIKNFGPLDATGAKIKLNKGSYISSVTALSSNCNSTTLGEETIFSIVANNTIGCFVAWTITAGNAVGTGTSTINGTLGRWFGNLSFSTTVSVPTTTTTTASQTPTPSITTTTIISTTTTTIPITPVNVTVSIPLITPASPATFNITQSETLKIQSITVAVKNNVSKVSIMVKEGQQPTGAPNITTPEEGLVLKYLEIVPTNITDADVANVTINFQIEKSWVTTNNIDVETIALYRYSNNSWNKLQTNKINETSTYFYFQASSPGLSVFAIAGQKTKVFPWLTVIIVVAAVGGIILAYLFWPVKGERKTIILPQEKRDEARETWETLKKKWDELIKKKT